MLKTDSECRINGVQIMQVSISITSLVVEGADAMFTLESVYSTIESQEPGNVITHGRLEAGNNIWSPKTRTALLDLVRSMESDLLPQHFKVEGTNAVSEFNEEEVSQI
jgi:hypothetical protein